MENSIEKNNDNITIELPYFNVTIQSNNLSVVFIKNELIAQSSWLLIKLFNDNNNNSNDFFSLVHDDDGISIIFNPKYVDILSYLVNNNNNLIISDQEWNAMEIIITNKGYELPGIVYFLANTLSQEGVSIFHISTFESEVFIVQNNDINKIISILNNNIINVNINNIIQSKAQDQLYIINNNAISTDNISDNSSEAVPPLNDDNSNDTNLMFDSSWMAPAVQKTPSNKKEIKVIDNSSSISTMKKDVFYLTVMPQHVILAKLKDNYNITDFSDIIIKLLLFDERYSILERSLINRNTSTTSGSRFMWGVFKCNSEYTLLMPEEDISLFPQQSITTSPQHWKIIKLCGRPIGFDEVGIVSSMIQIEANVPSLNISTTTTNCTLVPNELLTTTVNTLSRVLKCSVEGDID